MVGHCGRVCASRRGRQSWKLHSQQQPGGELQQHLSESSSMLFDMTLLGPAEEP